MIVWAIIGLGLLVALKGTARAGAARQGQGGAGTVLARLPRLFQSSAAVQAAAGNEPLQVRAPMNTNVIRLEGGTRFAEAQPVGTSNVLFQSGRDPGEARQPVPIIITDDSNALANIDMVLSASLPTKSPRLPSVSLGPTVGQQASGLISFYAGGKDAGGNASNTGRAIENFV